MISKERYEECLALIEDYFAKGKENEIPEELVDDIVSYEAEHYPI